MSFLNCTVIMILPFLSTQARQYTDLAGFSLRCLVCGKALTGQTDAQSHATLTGHINFGEV